LKGFAGIVDHVKVCYFEEPPLWKAAAVIDIFGQAAQGCSAMVSWLLDFDGAAAFAFAGVFPFATLVTGLAATLAFTGVLSFAGMGFTLLRHGLERDSGLGGFAGCIGADRERPGHEPGHRGARDECFRCIHLVFFVSCF